MPITLDQLRAAGNRVQKSASRTLHEARAAGMETAFLCHSHHDVHLVNGAVTLLQEHGWNIYVDWADETMPETPNAETAAKIKAKIVELNYFLFLATPNSMASRWCPWEIGYADGKKPIDKIFIIPTTDQSGKWYGSEYLQLYRHIDVTSAGAMGAWYPGQTQGTNVRYL